MFMAVHCAHLTNFLGADVNEQLYDSSHIGIGGHLT